MSLSSVQGTDLRMKFVTIDHESLAQPLKLNSFWLRDHCRCSKCYSTSFQRSFNILDIPLDVDSVEVKNENGIISIKCMLDLWK